METKSLGSDKKVTVNGLKGTIVQLYNFIYTYSIFIQYTDVPETKIFYFIENLTGQKRSV